LNQTIKNLQLGAKMRKPTVFVTQIPHRKVTGFAQQSPRMEDSKPEAFIPAMNISPAAEFGEIKVMFPPRVSFFNTLELSKQLHEILKDYNYEAGDCLLPLGDPILIASACAMLGKHGRFYVLRWDKNLGRYTRSTIII